MSNLHNAPPIPKYRYAIYGVIHQAIGEKLIDELVDAEKRGLPVTWIDAPGSTEHAKKFNILKI